MERERSWNKDSNCLPNAPQSMATAPSQNRECITRINKLIKQAHGMPEPTNPRIQAQSCHRDDQQHSRSTQIPFDIYTIPLPQKTEYQTNQKNSKNRRALKGKAAAQVEQSLPFSEPARPLYLFVCPQKEPN